MFVNKSTKGSYITTGLSLSSSLLDTPYFQLRVKSKKFAAASVSSFIRRLLAVRVWKARRHCSKRSQYRRAWRQVGQRCQRASSEGSVPLACRDMRAPGRVGDHTPLLEVAWEASLSRARLEGQ